MSNKSGFVTIIGNPNVGKSSLFNALLNFELSVVTHKSQTTRDSIKGILTTDNFQLVLSDTPGHVESSYLLHDKMNKNIYSSLEGSDIILYVTDVKEKKINQKLIDAVINLQIPIIYLVNKSDLDKNYKLLKNDSYKDIFLVSSNDKKDVDKILTKIVEYLPEHPAFYSKEELTDKNERFIVSEIVRGEIFKSFSQEVPYSTYVEINTFKNEEKILRIEGYIYVETESQKSILLGKKGKKIRDLSKKSRLLIEEMYNKQVYINFTIKVLKWRNDQKFIHSKY
jgi:GTP-binding protein Era